VRRRWVLLAAIGAFIILFDQASKFLAVKHLTPGLDERSGLSAIGRFYGDLDHPCRGRSRLDCPTVQVIEGVWYWRYVENPGAAWGFLRNAHPSIRRPFFLVVPVLAGLFILSIFRGLREEQLWMIVALSLVFGGAIGNLIDRIHLSYVIDFIDCYIGTYHWPTFNVADSAISVGVVMMLLEWIRDAIRGKGKASTKAAKASPKGAS
jgi:signal peptidase II